MAPESKWVRQASRTVHAPWFHRQAAAPPAGAQRDVGTHRLCGSQPALQGQGQRAAVPPVGPRRPAAQGVCAFSPTAGHPDGVRDSDRVLGPRPRGPAHGPVRGGALQRTGAPGQALREELLRGEDPGRWLAEHYQIALLGQAGPRLKRLPLSPKNGGSGRLPLNLKQCFLEARGGHSPPCKPVGMSRTTGSREWVT